MALNKPDTGDTDWLDNYNDNWEELNNNLLFLGTQASQQLDDVDVTAGAGLVAGAVLKYNAATQKWEPWVPSVSYLTTTTTTTTTTSTTSTTTAP